MRLSASLLFLLACNTADDSKSSGGEDTSAEPWRPTVVCPGDAACETAEGELEVGAGAVSITPTCFERFLDCGEDGLCPDDEGWVEPDSGEGDAEWDKQTEVFEDCGCDQMCSDHPDYPGADDGEGNGEFDAIWLAGFQNGRPANTVNDDIWARTVAFRQGDTTVAIVSIDVVGFFFDDVQETRALIAEQGIDVDHVMITSTHNHEAPDTLGQWGLQVGRRGVDDDWMEDVKRNIAQSVSDAVGSLQPAEMMAVSVDVSEYVPEKGTRNLVNDKRDPRIVDEMMGVALFRSTADGSTIASVINFGNHPEALADENNAITSDFAHYLREGMENGIDWESGPIEGLGGTSVYLQAAVGGMMTPLGVEVTDLDGAVHNQSDFAKAQAIGHMMASQALQALEGAEVQVDPQLALRATEFYLPIENYAFQAMFLMGVFEREAYNYDKEANLTDSNMPELLTEMDLLDVGPIRMLSVPGELLPELAIGGFDGSHTNIGDYTDPIVDLEQEFPADLSKAPEGPFLKERMDGAMNWIIGLGNDELGYIIPEYNYILDDRIPYLEEAGGDDYEETNSLGAGTAPLVNEWADRLITWTPEGE
jgi:hypothetical protein